MELKTLFLLVCYFTLFSVLGQTTDPGVTVTKDTTKKENLSPGSVTPPDTTQAAAKDTSSFNYFFNTEEESKFLEYKPIINFGTGILSFYGEASGTPKTHPVIGHTGFSVGVSKNINDFFALGLSAIM
jgi:hypothetical protein